jgi:ribosome-binding protein aMBF1 (putative translation factor)
MFEQNSLTEMVDAIKDGKIVRVQKSYAKREGLLILGKPKEIKEEVPNYSKSKPVEEKRMLLDDYRRPLKWAQNQVVKELITNFNWEISKARRNRNWSRRQLADAINEKEDVVKMLENGILPKDDFVLINKIQDVLKINIRKDKTDFSQPLRSRLDVNWKERIKEKRSLQLTEVQRENDKMAKIRNERVLGKTTGSEIEEEKISGDEIEVADE